MLKIRSGFVSNSSTSSYIIYGVKLSDISSLKDLDYAEIREKIENIDKSLCYSSSEEGGELVGYKFTISDEDYFMSCICDLDQIIKITNKLKEAFKEDNLKIRVFGGVMSC